MTIKNIFDEISSESSTNEKMRILGKYKDNKLFCAVLYYALSKRVKFYLKQIPNFPSIPDPKYDLQAALDDLQPLRERRITGNNAIELLRTILSHLTPDDAYIVACIIDKDVRLGMGSTNINKVIPNLIEDTPYMGAKAFSEELARDLFKDNPVVLSQIKMDGRYANVTIENGIVESESRNGEPNYLEGALFMEELKKFPDCVLNGEYTIDGIPRYQSNGLITSLISIGKKRYNDGNIKKELIKFEKKEGMEFEDALNLIKYTVWDQISIDEYIKFKSEVKYSKRLENVENLIKTYKTTHVRLISTDEINTYEEAINLFQKALKNGEEGTILKSPNAMWIDGKHPFQIKMKLEIATDLKIVGFNLGTGKNAQLISSLNVESMDGIIQTSPAGMDNDTMEYVTNNQDKLLGTIVEVKSCGLSKDESGKYSLLHPRVERLRDDKTTGDTFESVVEIENMAKGLIIIKQ